MNKDETITVQAFADAVQLLLQANTLEEQALAFLRVRCWRENALLLLQAPPDEGAEAPHKPDVEYELEVFDESEWPEGKVIGWSAQGCGYDATTLEDALSMLDYEICEGRQARIVRCVKTYAVVAEQKTAARG